MVVAGHRGLRVRRRRRAAGVRRPGHGAGRSGRPGQLPTRRTLLETLGGTVRLGPGVHRRAARRTPTWWSPPAGAAAAPLLVQAAARGVPIWSEVELAWRLSRPAKVVPWLGITGTNGKTTTTQMLESILARGRAADRGGRQHRPADHGDRARPGAVRRAGGRAVQPPAALVALAGPALGRGAQPAARPPGVARLATRPTRDAKAKIYAGVQASCVYNVADPATERMVEEAEVVEGARAIGFTLGIPGRRCSAWSTTCWSTGPSSSSAGTRPSSWPTISRRLARPAPHNVANALAAAALARSYGVPATRGPRRSAQRSGRGAQDRDRSPSATASAGSTTPRRPTRTPPTRHCARSTSVGLDRRRPGQGDDLRRAGQPATGTGCAARCCSAWTVR